VRWIQPGIESLDDSVLALIAKGNSALMNVQLLKWSCELIDAAWNMLRHSGRSDAWRDMARWLPAIFHLQPPTGVTRVRYDRFSPCHMRPDQFGLTLEPSRAYRYVYPFQRLVDAAGARSRIPAVRRHAHRGLVDEPGQQRLQQVVREWNECCTRRRGGCTFMTPAIACSSPTRVRVRRADRRRTGAAVYRCAIRRRRQPRWSSDSRRKRQAR
jgi:hypothetical protein